MPPRYWFSRTHPFALLLLPVAWIFGCLRALRVLLYDLKILKTHKLTVPVVVVGNVVSGGVGKTPLVIELVLRLQRMGYQPGVLSRGYGRKNKLSQLITAASTASEVGDEPLLIANTCQAPVAVAANRVQAAKILLFTHPECDVLVCDDGLQHLALNRDIEIVLFDERGLGNRWLLPAGPLREPWPRVPRCPVHLILNHMTRSLAPFALDNAGEKYPIPTLKDKPLHAVAGIARPDKFYQMLREQGLILISTRSFSDHTTFKNFDPIKKLACNPATHLLCTEKDAVKLWAQYPQHAQRILAVPLIVNLDDGFLSVFDATLRPLIDLKKNI